jgi:hypothetical protein
MRFKINTPAAFGILLSASFVVFGCSKDKFTTRPQLEFKKVNSYEISRGGIMEFTLGFTDKEGDISDTIWIQLTTTSCPASNRTLSYKIPDFPESQNSQGQFEIAFVNGVFVPGYVALPGPACGRPDTTTFSFWARDKAKNMSDTVQTDKPIIIYN